MTKDELEDVFGEEFAEEYSKKSNDNGDDKDLRDMLEEYKRESRDDKEIIALMENSIHNIYLLKSNIKVMLKSDDIDDIDENTREKLPEMLKLLDKIDNILSNYGYEE